MSSRITIKNPIREIFHYRRRVIFGCIIVVIAIIMLVTRLLFLQVVEHNKYTTLSEQNRLDLLPIEPNRGLIYDRNGVILAKNIPVYSLDIVPGQVKNLDETITALQQIINIDDDTIKTFEKLVKQHRRFQPVPLKIKLSEAEVARFMVNRYKFPGVSISTRLMRQYPLGSAVAAVTGYVGRINENELNRVNPSNYSATNYIGKVGIEKYYENQLHGYVGYQQVETDAAGHIVRTLERVDPIPGQDLYLTIDSKVEIAAEKAFGDTRGAVVAIQPSTGQVLALVSNPGYDPNLFVTGISHDEYKTLTTEADQPLFNRAIRGQYPPASTVKPILALDGLASNTVTPDYTIWDPGYFSLPDSSHKYRDWKYGGHGYVDVKSAIVQSCDTYFYNLANKLGIKRLDSMLSKFGFGKKTDLDIGEELPGLVPNPDWKRAMKGKPWYPGDTLITGIGQGFLLTTPLQMAQATAIIANRGVRYKPYLLLQSQAPDKQITETQPTTETFVKAPKKDWDLVISGMHGVISAILGTGFRFGKPKYSVAAKTGTAQVFSVKQGETYNENDVPERLRNHSLFIAFAPVKNPQIAVAVVAENSNIAPYVARKTLDAYFASQKEQKVKVNT